MRAIGCILCVSLFATALVRADPSPPYDEVAGLATHNSYWVRRSFELGASGTQERILDQLVYEGVSAIELDIHARARQPGVWGVYHTNKESNSSCSPLSECLQQLQLLQYLAPQHDVINVIVELKELWGHALDGEHTIEQLDRLFASLGPALYSPRQFLARCPSGATLRECARHAGWPTRDELRGKIIVNLLGNWNRNADDWITYATDGNGVIDRAAFPMRTILSPHGLTRFVSWWRRPVFTRARVEAAFAAAIFWQVGDPRFSGLRQFLDEHGVVRSPYAGRGFQLRQTDRPWQEARRDRPGLHLLARDAGTLALATRADSSAARDAWETAPAVSAAAHGRAAGCLRAAASDEAQSFMICKRVLDGEILRVSLYARHAGAATTVRSFDAAGPPAGRVGDLLSLRVERAGPGSCVVAASASQVNGARPAWNVLARDCFSVPLARQGLAARGDVIFAGTRHDDAPVTAAALIFRDLRAPVPSWPAEAS
jgi:hypothetical protein